MKTVHGFKRFAGAILLSFAATACEAEIPLSLPAAADSSKAPSVPPGNAVPDNNGKDGAGISPEEKRSLKLALDLTEGSHLIGVPSLKSLRINTSFATMEIEFAKISTIQIDHKTSMASVSFMNGDKLSGVLDVKAIEVKGLFGECSIALEHIAALSVLSGDLTLPASLRKGLVLYYSFDRPGSGGVVTDKSGKGNHGKVKGAKWAAAGNTGSYVLSDKNDEITGSDLHLPAGDAARSASLWFKHNADSEPDSASFITWGNPVQHNQGCHIGFDRRVGRFGVCFSQSGAVDVSSKKIIKADEWHHAVFVYTGSGKTQFYVDDADHGLQADEIQSPINTVLSGQLRLGASDYKGQIGEVMIYDRALSGQEVDQIFNLQKKCFKP